MAARASSGQTCWRSTSAVSVPSLTAMMKKAGSRRPNQSLQMGQTWWTLLLRRAAAAHGEADVVVVQHPQVDVIRPAHRVDEKVGAARAACCEGDAGG